MTPLLSLLLEEAQSYSALLGALISDALVAAASIESGSDQLASTLADSIAIASLLGTALGVTTRVTLSVPCLS